jgi:hypothetical protein
MTHLPQLSDFTVPRGVDVLRKKRHDKIFAIAVDRNLPSKKLGAFPKGLNNIEL